ncbi:GntR family transcriptional regulator [Nonomuraea angiospora]|uniref:GntR family transcriptional regulator n=1 Tax=Nonomuraea angiospora TaxID=46172 RepID=UPI0033206EC3
MNRWLTGWRVFTQIEDRLREGITMSMYPAGSMLPFEGALCAECGVARNTVLILTIPAKGRLALGGDKPKDEPYLYQAIARELRGEIERGELQPGTTLPGEAQLRCQHGVSRSIVRQSLAVLEQEGLIASEHGRGRFVRRRDVLGRPGGCSGLNPASYAYRDSVGQTEWAHDLAVGLLETTSPRR